MKKRLIAVMLTAVIAAGGVTGCGAGTGASTSAATEATTQEASSEVALEDEWMNDPTFRQIMRGNYLDYLYDCPYEMHDLTGQEYLRRPVMRLKEEHKEIIYFLYLRLYEPKDLAAVRGQTSRNIRKVRDVAQRKVRRQVYASLQERKAAGCSLTKDERDFLAECKPNGIKPPLKNHKKESA